MTVVLYTFVGMAGSSLNMEYYYTLQYITHVVTVSCPVHPKMQGKKLWSLPANGVYCQCQNFSFGWLENSLHWERSHAFRKNREGGWQHCACRVCMNQDTEFSYVTLISTWINILTSWCCVIWQRSDVAKRNNGVWEVVAKNKGRYQKFSFLGEMHCQPVMVRTFAIA